MFRLTLFYVVLLGLALVPLHPKSASVTIGSKLFTESVILGECVRLLCDDAGIDTTHYRELGGTRILFDALVSGDISVYPEYSGTIREEIFRGELETDELIHAALTERGIGLAGPLGFNNTYAMAMLRTRAAELGVTTISDLARHPDLKCGFSNEFMERQDGWPGMREYYDLGQLSTKGLNHDLAYRQLQLGQIDVIDAYATDAKIAALDLVLLEDDRNYFPRYDAVVLYRVDLADQHPDLLRLLQSLEGGIDNAEMVRANALVEMDGKNESEAAAMILDETLGIQPEVHQESLSDRLFVRSLEHIDLIRRSLIPAILIGIPLGVLATLFPSCGRMILGAAGIIQTIPALAMLVLLMPLMSAFGQASVGTGSATAVTALFLYALLPIVQGTHTGLKSIPLPLQHSMESLGLPLNYRLLHIDLPLAGASILAGVKTSTVLTVGFATLGALIGAGGYGQPIMTGIRLNSTALILEGAIPAAIMAVVSQLCFDLVERSYSTTSGRRT
ncbi:MAG: ABC transporter permease subunit [Planctomycetaceae bacterium]|nr:ABC transporter permease subunit [Planctomycetaceae bacterium]